MARSADTDTINKIIMRLLTNEPIIDIAKDLKIAPNSLRIRIKRYSDAVRDIVRREEPLLYIDIENEITAGRLSNSIALKHKVSVLIVDCIRSVL